MKRTLILLGLLVPIGAALWYVTRPQPVEVSLIQVGRGPVERIAANSRAGTIRACRRSGLSMPSGGRVDELLVSEGDRVEAGQLLLQLHDAEQQALLAQSRANLRIAQIEQQSACSRAELAQREYRRFQSLAAGKLISTEQLDRQRTEARITELGCQQAAAQITQLEALEQLYQVQLDQRQLRAPFAGVVAEINGEPGEYTTPSPPGVATPPAVDLIDDSCLYVRAPIDEVEAAHLSLGQPARITLDAFRGESFAGTLGRIAPFVSELERQARTVDVDVHFTPVPDVIKLLVGYSADVEVILEQTAQQLRIPTETLLEGRYVLRYNPAEGRLEQVEVSTGASNWHWTAISAGLAEGDRILARLDTAGASAGARVRVASRGAGP